MSGDIRAKHQRAGYLYKLPMSKPDSDRWQRRLFVAKDGFLLYYSPNKSPDSQHFDTKVKGVIPLGGCTTEKCERGPKGCKFGLKISHPDFYVGRQLVLACDSADEQKEWLETLNECGRVIYRTMENALLGDSMIEKLQAEGTAAEEEKRKALEELQQNAMKLKKEQEEKKRLAEEAQQTEEMKEKVQELENQMATEREELEKKLKEQEEATHRQLEEKSKAVEEVSRQAEEAQRQASSEMKEEERAELQRRAEELQREKERLEEQRTELADEVSNMSQNQQELRQSLQEVSAEKDNMEKRLHEVQENSKKLQREQQQRRRLERKLQVAEDSLKRLDDALRRSGVKLDIDVFADVKTLKSFFEERVDEVRRDAQKIDIMKQALNAKKKYLMAGEVTESADNSNGASASAKSDAREATTNNDESGEESESGDETW